jgi:hypothetical protein
MRSTFAEATVRLYWLHEADPVAQTLCYAPLAEALALAASQPEAVQQGLWIATDNDVVRYLDLAEG